MPKSYGRSRRGRGISSCGHSSDQRGPFAARRHNWEGCCGDVRGSRDTNDDPAPARRPRPSVARPRRAAHRRPLLATGGGARRATAAPRQQPPAAATLDVGTAGQWSGVLPWVDRAVNAHVLPTGKVMYWPAWFGDAPARIWDPATGHTVDAPFAGYNIFCTGRGVPGRWTDVPRRRVGGQRQPVRHEEHEHLRPVHEHAGRRCPRWRRLAGTRRRRCWRTGTCWWCRARTTTRIAACCRRCGRRQRAAIAT